MTIQGSSEQKNIEVKLKNYTYFATKEICFDEIIEGEKYIINGRLYEYGIPFSKEYVFNGDYGLVLPFNFNDCIVPRRSSIIFDLSKEYNIYKTDLICNSSYNDFNDKSKPTVFDKKPCSVVAEIKTQYESTEWVREESDLSYIDIIKQNMEIYQKYNLDYAHSNGFLKEKVCDVIKKLEIEIFNLRGQLNLSREINAKDEEIIKTLREIVELKK